MIALHIIILIFGSLLSSHGADHKYRIFCHWDINSSSRNHSSSFYSWNIDLNLCTHLVIGSAVKLDPKGSGALKIDNEDFSEKRGAALEWINLKDDSRKIVSVGEWQDDPKMFSKMLADVRKRDQFYISLSKLLFEYEFGGVHLDWKYPAQKGSQSKDRENFVMLLKELKIILQEQKLLLLVSVSARLDNATRAYYDIPQIAKHADYIILNSHDHHDPFSGRLGYISPLYGNGSQSVERGVLHWVRQSGTPEKLLLGIPLFAQSYTLEDLNNTVVGAPSKGPGRKHAYSQRPGFMTSAEFCTQAGKWEKSYDKKAQAPYAYKDDQWVTYEDGRSISAKMHLAIKQRLGGAMALSIDADDFMGQCGEHFGLLKVMISLIGNRDMLTTKAPTTEGFGICPREGLFRNPWSCQSYYECRDGFRTDFECDEDENFDEVLGQCKDAKEVKCDDNFVNWRPGQETYNYRDLPLNLRVIN